MLKVRLEHSFSGFDLDAEFEAEAKSITALFGKSGSGKTTLINQLAGLEQPAKGCIELDGEILFDSEKQIHVPPEHRRLGYVFQDGRLFPHLTVRGNLTYGEKKDATIDFNQIIDLLDIGSILDRRPANLSGGERQRVAIGRALLSSPRLLLMDEPLASIDVQRRADILPFIERLRDELGMTIVYVSHAIEEVIRLADTMVVLSAGKVAATGGVEELMSRLDLHPLTGRFEAGAVLATTYESYDPEFDLATLRFDGGALRVPGLNLPEGATLRAHIRARDVSLMLSRPADTSILNIFEGEVVEIQAGGGPQVDIRLDIGSPLNARITRKSLHDLNIKTGTRLFALVKAVAIDRSSLGAQSKR